MHRMGGGLTSWDGTIPRTAGERKFCDLTHMALRLYPEIQESRVEGSGWKK